LTEPTGVGARLKQAREAQGLGIDDVAQQLKFAPRQIESLEHERFDRLPGPTIARGMVRNYARLLRLDPEPLVERMPAQADKTPDPGRIAERFRQEVPFSEGAKRSTLIYAGFSIGLLVLVGVVAYEWQQEKANPQFVAPARDQPEPVAAPSEPLTPAPVAQAPAVVAEPPPKPPLIEQKKPQAAPAVAAEKLPAVAAEKPPAATAENAPAAEGHRLVLRCQEESWVEVTDGTGRPLIAALIPAGGERVLRGRPPFELIIGNAASVRLTYDGKPVDLRPHTRVEVARLKLK
jgi:cytoskeleton protein RodZ